MKFWLVLGAVLCLCGSAQASTVVVSENPSYPYTQWIERAKVPTPDVTLRVIEGGCSETNPGSCTSPGWFAIHLGIEPTVAMAKATFMHEVGHNLDYYALDDGERGWFMTTAGLSGAWRSDAGYASPHEVFAEAYRQCATASWRWRSSAPEERITPNMRQICSVIRRSAG